MRRLKTYELYTISMGIKSLLLRTTNKKEIIKRYTAMVTAGSCPRISVDGEQLSIVDAENQFNQNRISHQGENRTGGRKKKRSEQ